MGCEDCDIHKADLSEVRVKLRRYRRLVKKWSHREQELMAARECHTLVFHE